MSGLRPLNPDGSPKSDRQLSDGDRRMKEREAKTGRNLRSVRGARGRLDRESHRKG